MFRTNTRRRRQTKRQTLQLRDPGIVTPFAVVGFAVVVLLAALMLKTYSDLVVVNDQTVKLQSKISALEEEQAKLLTQYELAYDLQAIEEQMLSSGTMVKQQPNQIKLLELTGQDSVEYYQDDSIFHSLAEAARGIISAITAYF